MLHNFTDEELLHHAYRQRDTLTTTDLEIDLARRLTECLAMQEVFDAVEAAGFDASDVADWRSRLDIDPDEHNAAVAIQVAALEHDIDDPDRLRHALARLEKLEQQLEDTTTTTTPD